MKFLVIASAAVVVSTTQAAEVVSLRSVQDQMQQSLKGTLTSKALPSAMSFKKSLSQENGITLTQRAGVADGSKYEMSYKGVPVWGHTLVITKDKNGAIDRLHGYAVRGIDKDVPSVKAKISTVKAIQIAKAYHETALKIKDKWSYEDLKSDLYIYVGDDKKASLVYAVTFMAQLPNIAMPVRPVIMVDATTEKVLSYVDQINLEMFNANGYGGNTKTGAYAYTNILVSKTNDTCTMDTPNLMTVDLNGQGDLSKPMDKLNDSTPFSFTCPTNTYKQINEAYSPMNDAHVNGLAIIDMYQKWFNLYPLEKGLKLKMRVHFGKDLQNAFWDGKSMTFGDGGKMLYPLATALDVTAHEVSHGFTSARSKLLPLSEAGSLNESFSDIAGEAAEYFSRGKNDWVMGAEIMKNAPAMRYFADPKLDKASIDNVADYKWPQMCSMLLIASRFSPELAKQYLATCTDAHNGSGIYNKAFYLMATAPGSDVPKAFAVFVRANEKYWTEQTTFVDGAKGVKDAATELGFDIKTVVDSFKAVGINI